MLQETSPSQVSLSYIKRLIFLSYFIGQPPWAAIVSSIIFTATFHKRSLFCRQSVKCVNHPDNLLIVMKLIRQLCLKLRFEVLVGGLGQRLEKQVKAPRREEFEIIALLLLQAIESLKMFFCIPELSLIFIGDIVVHFNFRYNNVCPNLEEEIRVETSLLRMFPLAPGVLNTVEATSKDLIQASIAFVVCSEVNPRINFRSGS